MTYPWITHGQRPPITGYAVTPSGEDDVARSVNHHMRQEGLDPHNNNHRMGFVDQANQQAVEAGNPRAKLITFDDKTQEVYPSKSGVMGVLQKVAGYREMKHDPDKPSAPGGNVSGIKAG